MKNPFKFKDPFDDEVEEPVERDPWKAPIKDIEEIQSLFGSLWDDYGHHVKRILFGAVGLSVIILVISIIVMNPFRAFGLFILFLVGMLIYGIGSAIESSIK